MTYIGQALPRIGDLRLTTGGGRYVSDVVFPGTVYLAMVRSPYAHARVLGIDAGAALAHPGVLAVVTPQTLGPLMRPLPASPPDPKVDAFAPPPLADGVVRYVGEPVAAVAAESRYLAEDAAELVSVAYEPLPVVTDALAADASGTFLFPEHGTNVVARLSLSVGSGRAGLAEGDVVVRTRLRLGRVVAHAMEPRAVVAVYDPASGVLTVYASTQSVHRHRDNLAQVFGLDPARVRVLAPDVGGGFGVKNRLYAEDVVAPFLAMRLGRPVKWVGDRREEFLSTNQERDQVHDVEAAFRRDGTIVAVADRFVQDNGAYCHSGLVVPWTTAASLPGPYRVPHLAVEGEVVLTNKVPIAPYRGAGRPQGTHVMERLLDFAADTLGLDRLEIRRRNLIRPEEIPFDRGFVFRQSPLVIREGDFPRVMEEALRRADVTELRRRQAALRSEGRRIGLGVANFLELSAGGMEGARVRLLPGGLVEVATGAASQGQGHPTMLAQIAADRLGVPIDRIRVVEGDSAAIARGVGTFGSRTTVTAGNATSRAVRTFREKVLEAVGRRLEAPPDELVWEDGTVHVRGVPARSVSLADLAEDAEVREALTVEAYFESDETVTGFGTHVVAVELDPDTLALRFLRYVVVHDGGVVVNPLTADGQTIGATVQGLGTALYEELLLDDGGQPQNTTFMDYLLPGAAEMPDLEIHELPFPALSNPEGFKGLAEGGIMPPMSAVLAAVEDALGVPGLRLEEIPLPPGKLHRTLRRLGVTP